MKKIVSVALEEGLLKALDEEALEKGISRSELVSTLLTERYGAVSQRIILYEVMSQVARSLEELQGVALMKHRRGKAIEYRTSAHYAYRPKVTYRLELEEAGDHIEAILRIDTRSTSADFCRVLWRFFAVLNEIEKGMVDPAHRRILSASPYHLREERMEKRLIFRPTDAMIEGYIADYLGLLQRAFSNYFIDLKNPKRALASIERAYETFLQGGMLR